MPVYSLYSFHRTFIPAFEYLTPLWSTELQKNFTFQYGSINTMLDTANARLDNNFTFQYGSINTQHVLELSCHLLNSLHSNMVLLIRDGLSLHPVGSVQLYIPIWFY